ncbi:GtrA family protein [Arenimonas alkanexedens]
MKAQFTRFIIVGAAAAAANIGSRVVFSLWLSYVPAIVLAFFVGLATAFLLNRAWVFLPSGKHWFNEASWFTLINLLGLGQTLAIAWVLTRHAFPAVGMRFHPETIGHVIGVMTPIITSFIGHKYLTFRK